MDSGFWRQLGYKLTIELNEEVWNKTGRLIAKEIKERFSLLFIMQG